MSLPPILNRALKAAYEGANEIIHFSKRIDNLEVTKKGENDVTTNLDKYVENIVFDKSKSNKLIFDGYPRTINQAKNLDNLLNKSKQKIDYIFFLNVNKETIIKRIEKRKVLEKRLDDDSTTILKRYDTYMETTQPVLNFYSKNSNFYEIDGTLEIDEITAKIDAFIKV